MLTLSRKPSIKPASQLDTILTSSRVQVQVRVHNSTTSSFTLLYLTYFYNQPSGAFSTLFYSALTGYSHRNPTWCSLTLKSPIILIRAHSLSFFPHPQRVLQPIICLVKPISTVCALMEHYKDTLWTLQKLYFYFLMLNLFHLWSLSTASNNNTKPKKTIIGDFTFFAMTHICIHTVLSNGRVCPHQASSRSTRRRHTSQGLFGAPGPRPFLPNFVPFWPAFPKLPSPSQVLHVSQSV